MIVDFGENFCHFVAVISKLVKDAFLSVCLKIVKKENFDRKCWASEINKF